MVSLDFGTKFLKSSLPGNMKDATRKSITGDGSLTEFIVYGYVREYLLTYTIDRLIF